MYIFITVTNLKYTDNFTLPTAESKCALETATHLPNWCSIEANRPCIENYNNTSITCSDV